jgi:hypothetical protein
MVVGLSMAEDRWASTDPREATMPDPTDYKSSQSPSLMRFPSVFGPRTPESKHEPARHSWLIALRCWLHRMVIYRERAAGA